MPSFFTWKMEERSRYAVSPRFKLGKEGTDSYLSVNCPNRLYLYLHSPVTDIKGHFCIFVLDAKNQIIHRESESEYLFSDSEQVNLLSKFGEFYPSSEKFPITVTCIWNSVGFHNLLLKTKKKKASDTVLLVNNLKQLSSDFKKVLDQNTNSDVVLKVEESNIRAHKLILQARSPVFNKMFDCDTLEAATNEVVISDLGAATIQRLLHFLYTGTVEKCSFQETIDLYRAADKYEVLSLRGICKTQLWNHLQVDNACLVFALASCHCDEDLKQRAVQFIRADFKSVIETNSFAELSKDDMLLLTRLSVSASKDQNR